MTLLVNILTIPWLPGALYDNPKVRYVTVHLRMHMVTIPMPSKPNNSKININETYQVNTDALYVHFPMYSNDEFEDEKTFVTTFIFIFI